MPSATDPAFEFLEAASVPRDAAHASGTLERADALLAANPGITGDLFVATALGDHVTVRRLVTADPRQAVTKGGPRGWDPLTYLCFSRYLRLDHARTAGFVTSATVLLDAGADPNGGWFEEGHQPQPVRESVLYGAAGVAHNAPLTQLLLERGADPNDDETPYHAPEGYDNDTLKRLVESGRLSADSLATMLIRKHDWHDAEGVASLLKHGADPNHQRHWGFTALHHAIARDNSLAIITLLLDHGADPWRTHNDVTAVAMAARRGRDDILALLRARGIAPVLQGVDQLIAACAADDSVTIALLRQREPGLVSGLLAMDGQVLAEFAGNGNTAGVLRLLELGVQPGAMFERGDGYWDVAPQSTALQVAAWRMRHESVRALVAAGAPLNTRDGSGRTPLALAIRTCVDSHWTDRRTPESVSVLLAAGATLEGIQWPSGYEAADDLLRRYGATARG